MELKRRRVGEESSGTVLLIVPYGIETHLGLLYDELQVLLIVPYGIETWIEDFRLPMKNTLLIVPYGIETSQPVDLYSFG